MKLTLFETSDMHSYVSPTDYISKKDLAFGMAKVATKLSKLRNKYSNNVIITIENGDFIQGSPLSYYLAKKYNSAELFAQIANYLAYDVHILGNHEFNYGLTYLKTAVKNYHAPVLAANILSTNNTPYFGCGYKIIEKAGIKIAILGLTTAYIPHWEKAENISGLTFESALQTAKKYVPFLKKQADIIIVSYHGGFERDLKTGEPTEALTGENEGYSILHEVSGINVLFTGHQHRALSERHCDIPIIQPGYRGNYIGEIQLTIKKIHGTIEITDTQTKLHSVDDVMADPKILEITKPYEEELERWLDKPLGSVNGNMSITNPMQARINEHPYIEFINRVQMAASGAKISATSLFNNDGKGFGKQISMRDVITNYIYPNTLAVLKINGSDLKAALEKTASFLTVINNTIVFDPKFIEPKPQYYNYDMYEGINYTIDMNKPVGQRITSLKFENKDILAQQEFEIVLNQYRALGGGDYEMFSPQKIIKEISIDMTELIADYLKANPVITTKVNSNFNVIL